MAIQHIASPPQSPSFHGSSHHGSQHSHHGIFTLNSTILIAAPIVVVLVLLVAFSLLLIFHRAKAKKNSCNSSTCNSSFRKNSFDRKQVSKCGFHINANTIGYSPDVRSCIYGGRLGFPLQDKKKGAQVFTYKELELATDGFSEGNAIGNGGFGVVYRGTLSDGTVAAIKLLHREGKQGEREFRMEVFSLRIDLIAFLLIFGCTMSPHYK